MTNRSHPVPDKHHRIATIIISTGVHTVRCLFGWPLRRCPSTRNTIFPTQREKVRSFSTIENSHYPVRALAQTVRAPHRWVGTARFQIDLVDRETSPKRHSLQSAIAHNSVSRNIFRISPPTVVCGRLSYRTGSTLKVVLPVFGDSFPWTLDCKTCSD